MYPPLRATLLLTASVDSASSHTAVFDSMGYDRVCLGVAFGTVANTNPEITLKVGEGDTTTAFTDITELVGGGTGGFTKPTPPTNTSVPSTMQFDVDARTRKRFLLLTVTPFTTKQVTSFAVAQRPEQGPPAVASAEGLMARIAV